MIKKIALVILLAFIMLPSLGFSKESNKPTKNSVKYEEFTGIKFGISHEELIKFLESFGNVTYRTEKESEGMTMYLYNSNHKLQDASGSMFSFYDDKFAVMGIIYQGEDSDETFDGLKLLIEEKYAKMKDEIMFSGKKSSLTKGNLYFTLQYDKNPFDGDKTFLMVGDLPLTNKAQEKKIKDKAKSLGEL